jgi:DNA mismatch repair protein MutS
MKLTPMLEQYFEIKRQVPDAILFYRLGDFYEMFFEDAERAAPILDLVLTARGKGGEWEAPMCGVPHHAADQYVAKLVRQGFRVAICEQTGDPKETKGIVRREIIRVVTPGTAIEGNVVERDACYLFGAWPAGGTVGAAFLDVSTGDFFVKTYRGLDDVSLRDDLSRIAPREALFPEAGAGGFGALLALHGIAASPVDSSLFDPGTALDHLTRHFGTDTLRGFGLDSVDTRVVAAAATLRYAAANHRKELTHVSVLRVDHDGDFLIVDAATLENLEILDARDARAQASLIGAIDQTRTSMGSRALRVWLCRPLRERESIFRRHDAVDELVRSREALEDTRETLSTIGDLERLASRATLRTITPRECRALAASLRSVARLRECGAPFAGPLLQELTARLDPLESLSDTIERTIEPEPASTAKEGNVISEGVDAELDALRTIARDTKSVLLRIEAAERERTGISSLKIRYNSVFGYYIEVSKTNLARVPPDYIRKQTLVNAERYITPELKELEERIVGAEEKSRAIEVRLYEALVATIAAEATAILRTAAAVAALDVLCSFAAVAIRYRYVRPLLSADDVIDIEQGRHPVIERLVERFIPNDTSIERATNGIQIITGPNMGGKSTYLRQVALIVLLNQAGSFVPAARATLGVFDRIFTRVGASDNLARGESTFMVEMHETANILNNATSRSLIVLDEVGRGTATFDGLSLAWAIIEYLHDSPERSAITLFATHYHEVTDLAKTRERVTNLNVAVREWNDQIIFLRKVVPGAADKSYGIQVAKLAGIPPAVISRAREILETLERKEEDVVEETRRGGGGSAAEGQLSLFDSREKQIANEIRALAIDELSPIEALNKLNELRERLTK